MLIAAIWHSFASHSILDARVGKHSKSSCEKQPFGSWDGAVLSKKSTGDATSKDVTNNVAVVIAILWTVADVLSQKHGAQHIHPETICNWKITNKNV